MKVLYFPHFPEHSYRTLVRELDPQARAYPGNVWLKYSSHFSLYCYWWPKLLLYGITTALRCLFSRPRADAMVVWTHLVVLPWMVLRLMLWIRRPRIVLLGFVYTTRSSPIKNRLRRVYYRFVLNHVDLVVCHTKHEASEYPRLLGIDPRKFAFVPCWAIDSGLSSRVQQTGQYIVSAGKSNRDFELLLKVAQRIPVAIRIVSDGVNTPTERLPKNVTVIPGCYGADYIDILAGAAFVVLPLKNAEISSGQLVMLESMGLGKALVVTRTLGTVDYVKHGETGVLVPPGDDESLLDAMLMLYRHPDEAARLGRLAQSAHRERFSTKSALGALLRLIDERFGSTARSVLGTSSDIEGLRNQSRESIIPGSSRESHEQV